MTMVEQETSLVAAGTATAGCLSPTDRIVLAYAVVLGVITALCGACSPAVLLAIAAFAVAVVAIARRAAVSRGFSVAHDFAVVAFLPMLYGFTGPIAAAANHTRWDARLAALDRAWFGALPAAWTALWGRPEWLTAVASTLYATYYVIPIAIIVALYRASRRAEFDSFVFTAAATFIASYTGYLLAPATGPRIAPGDETALGGAAMDGWLQAFLHLFERNQLDAFPSGHTALALVYLVLGWKLLPRWRWRVPLAVATAGIVFSTVYLSLHYVIDVVAGALLAATMLVASPALYRFVARRPSSGAAQAPPGAGIHADSPRH